MKLIMTIKMPHQKHFLKITLLFLKHKKKGKKLVFLVMKTIRAIIKSVWSSLTATINWFFPKNSLQFKKCLFLIKKKYLKPRNGNV